MSSKLLGCLEYCLYKLFPLRFQTVWLDTSFRIHAIFYGNEFFEGPEVDLVKGHVRDILIDNRKRNVNFWCTFLPYELKKENNFSYSLYMDYIKLLKIHHSYFDENGIDVSLQISKFWKIITLPN